jgi:uncharacterized cofD-like protein
MSAPPAIVALGGGHGLAASLSACRRFTDRLTAIVTVADDGGSSGRIRREMDVLPPGDLRMALAALCGDDAWGQTWASVLQHRFAGTGDLRGHALGNLLIVALTEQLGEPVTALDWVGRLLGARGRVLPMSAVPLEIEATVRGGAGHPLDALHVVRGQHEIAVTDGDVCEVRLLPPNPPVVPEAVEAVRAADWVVLGPGSWFTSVIPHLLVPELCDALETTEARRLLILNLESERGETDGLTPHDHLQVLAEHAPRLRFDTVLADSGAVDDHARLAKAAKLLGAELVAAPVAEAPGVPRHDVARLSTALREIVDGGVIDGRVVDGRVVDGGVMDGPR